MDFHDGMVPFIQRYQALRAHRDTFDQLSADLLVYVQTTETSLRMEKEELANELRAAQLDLADAARSRRQLQLELQRLESRLGSMLRNNDAGRPIEHDIQRVLQSHNPYVVVLIDGEGLLFKKHFVRKRIDGGKKAAEALKNAILKQCHGLASEIEVIAKVHADLRGLARNMCKDGSLEKETDLRDFAQGFTQGKASFDFIDVGEGKADAKMEEATTWHLKNYNCKHVILGISHDASYAPFVNELMRDEMTSSRITVLEGVPTVPELVATGVNVLNLNELVFRSERLVDRTSPKLSPLMPHALPPAFTSPRAAQAAPAPRPASTPAAPPTSYARAIKSASPPPQMTLPIPLKAKATNGPKETVQPGKPPPPAWDPGRRGLDSPLNVSKAALERIKMRKDNDKLCNNHYLRGPCSKGSECCFEHKYKPTPDEIVAIAFLTRLNPCTGGQECEVENCIYGHHCPTVRDGHCTNPHCKFFPSDHPPGCALSRKPSKALNDY